MRKEVKENLTLGISLISFFSTIFFGLKGWISMKWIINLWDNLNPWKTGFFIFLIIFIGSLSMYLIERYKEFKKNNKEKIGKIESDYRKELEMHINNSTRNFQDMQSMFSELIQTVNNTFNEIVRQFGAIGYLEDAIRALKESVNELNKNIQK